MEEQQLILDMENMKSNSLSDDFQASDFLLHVEETVEVDGSGAAKSVTRRHVNLVLTHYTYTQHTATTVSRYFFANYYGYECMYWVYMYVYNYMYKRLYDVFTHTGTWLYVHPQCIPANNNNKNNWVFRVNVQLHVRTLAVAVCGECLKHEHWVAAKAERTIAQLHDASIGAVGCAVAEIEVNHHWRAGLHSVLNDK